MALDTREKRENVPGVGRPWMRAHHTETIDEQWRIGVGLAYGGNALSPAAGGGLVGRLIGPGGLVGRGGGLVQGGGLV